MKKKIKKIGSDRKQTYKNYVAEVEVWVESESGKTVTIKRETSKEKEG